MYSHSLIGISRSRVMAEPGRLSFIDSLYPYLFPSFFLMRPVNESTAYSISHIPGNHHVRLSDSYTRRRGGFIINRTSHILPTFVADFSTQNS